MKRIAQAFVLAFGISSTSAEGQLTNLPTLPLFVAPNSALNWAEKNKSTSPEASKLIRARIAEVPQAVWLTDTSMNVYETVLRNAELLKQLPVFVIYNIPGRDNGNYSSGGVSSSEEYLRWLSELKRRQKGIPAVFIVEPDALALSKDMSNALRVARLALLRRAVETLQGDEGYVFLDAGHSSWLSADAAASYLKESGIQTAQGFVLNVSNFRTDEETIRYGEVLSKNVEGKHFIIDTSRNGKGPYSGEESWCNPPGRALGDLPTFKTGHPLVWLKYWVKHPGESDGTCRGGPGAGVFWSEYAIALIQNSAR